MVEIYIKSLKSRETFLSKSNSGNDKSGLDEKSLQNINKIVTIQLASFKNLWVPFFPENLDTFVAGNSRNVNSFKITENFFS